jgi:hypothetical protein
VWVLVHPKAMHGVSQEKSEKKMMLCISFQKDGMSAPGGVLFFEPHKCAAPLTSHGKQAARIWCRKNQFPQLNQHILTFSQ